MNYVLFIIMFLFYALSERWVYSIEQQYLVLLWLYCVMFIETEVYSTDTHVNES